MTDELKENQKTHEDEGTSSSKRSYSGSLMPGLFLIVLGLVFLANNLTGFYLDNWWALFILFPAANNFNDAIRFMRRDGGVSRKARGQFFWSFFFVLLSAAFLLGISVGQYWPVFLILAGIGILIGAL
jgi:hypothetical protein